MYDVRVGCIVCYYFGVFVVCVDFVFIFFFFFFFSSRRRHTRYWRDWSSDVCSSDLIFARRTLASTVQPSFPSCQLTYTGRTTTLIWRHHTCWPRSCAKRTTRNHAMRASLLCGDRGDRKSVV